MQTITELEFSAMIPAYSMNGLATEKYWFRHGAMLGVVLFDNVDKDWSWVALGQDQHGIFCAFDFGVSNSTSAEAVMKLQKVLIENENEKVFPQ